MGSALPVGDPAPTDGSFPADLPVRTDTAFGVYIHVPFCPVRCGYCDFNTYTADELRGARQADYADQVAREIDLAASLLAPWPRPAATVFFGGGTPTLLPGAALTTMLGTVRDTFGIVPGAEITVEANPDTMTGALAHELAEAGVTRLSIGMQSAVPSVLRTLDRTHNPANVRTAVDAARAAGLGVSLDLIYGTPGETLSDWECSLATALDLEPDHISAYALIVEEGTKLARQIRRGDVREPDDDLHADMYELADATLTAAGFAWYELSNWARTPADRSRHNLAYWLGTDWWGFGPGAHSHLAGLRWWNVKHPAAYAQRLAAGESPAAGRERPDAAAREVERIMLQSRLSEGLAIASLDAGARTRVAGLIADELVDGARAMAGQLVLTRKGRLLADAVVRDLTGHLPVAEP